MLGHCFPDCHDAGPCGAYLGTEGGPQPFVCYRTLDFLIENFVDVHDKAKAQHGGGCPPREYHFGAEVAFLFRDRRHMDGLPAAMRDRAVCLTIAEAKGQEFDIVFLVNFFGDSTFQRWTVLEEYTCSEACLKWRRTQDEEGKFEPGPPYPTKLHPYLQLEPTGRDRALCAELRHLYVGVTRARSQVVLLEEQRGMQSEPMVRLWTRQGVVVPPSAVDEAHVKEVLRAFAESNTPQQWCERARDLMERLGPAGDPRVWQQIAGFFECGNDPQMASFARGKACVSRACAEGDENARKSGLKAAAKLFEAAKSRKEEAECWELLQEWEAAGRLYAALPSEADCWPLLKAWGCLRNVPDSAECLPFLREHHRVLPWPELHPWIAHARIRACAEVKREVVDWAEQHGVWEYAGDMHMEDEDHERAVRAFEAAPFVNKPKLAEAYDANGDAARAAKLYYEVGRYADAARMYEKQGRLAEAIDMYQKVLPVAWGKIGACQSKLRLFEAAGASFQRAGQPEASVREYLAAVAKDPSCREEIRRKCVEVALETKSDALVQRALSACTAEDIQKTHAEAAELFRSGGLPDSTLFTMLRDVLFPGGSADWLQSAMESGCLEHLCSRPRVPSDRLDAAMARLVNRYFEAGDIKRQVAALNAVVHLSNGAAPEFMESLLQKEKLVDWARVRMEAPKLPELLARRAGVGSDATICNVINQKLLPASRFSPPWPLLLERRCNKVAAPAVRHFALRADVEACQHIVTRLHEICCQTGKGRDVRLLLSAMRTLVSIGGCPTCAQLATIPRPQEDVEEDVEFTLAVAQGFSNKRRLEALAAPGDSTAKAVAARHYWYLFYGGDEPPYDRKNRWFPTGGTDIAVRALQAVLQCPACAQCGTETQTRPALDTKHYCAQCWRHYYDRFSDSRCRDPERCRSVWCPLAHDPPKFCDEYLRWGRCSCQCGPPDPEFEGALRLRGICGEPACPIHSRSEDEADAEVCPIGVRVVFYDLLRFRGAAQVPHWGSLCSHYDQIRALMRTGNPYNCPS